MSSPTKSENKDPTFPAEDPIMITQDQGQEQEQQQLEEDQNPPQSSSPRYSAQTLQIPDAGKPDSPCKPNSPPYYPQSPKPITLEIPDGDEPDSQANDRSQDDPEPGEIIPLSPTMSDSHISSSTSTLTFSSRFGGGGRRKKRNIAQEKKSQKKLEILTGTLNLIPFVPVKTLDLPSHESLLRRLGLWDFAQLDFGFKLRHDLILQLIASFRPAGRCSKVNDIRIMVNRADLARALCLPLKKEKLDNALEEKENGESVSFIEEFVSNFLLLHEDTWMMTDDILNTMKMIKEGNFEKVDFARLIWQMVVKELTNPELGNCYYASHLQLLIKSQREDLLKEQEPVTMEIDVKEDGKEEEVVTMSEELPGESELEEHNIELSLGGHDNAVTDDDIKERKEQWDDDDNAMDLVESKEDEQGQWLSNSMGSHFLQRCNLGEVGSAVCEEERKQEEEDDEEDEEEEEEEEEEDGEEGEYEEKEEEMGFGISAKDVSLEGLNSENLIAAIEASQNPFSSGMQNRDNMSSVDFLGSRVGMVQTMPGGSSHLNNGNGSKRAMGHLENDMPNHALHGGNKRMRSDGHWNNLNPASEFAVYMDQMQHVMGKTRMLYEAKEQACEDLSMHNQMLSNEVEQRTNMIHNLHKAKMEEQQKRQMETYRLEHELYMMENLLEGYRKALRATSSAFAEYRKKCPLPEEPIYKDTGSGGLVLSTTEWEKQRFQQEEEERLQRLKQEEEERLQHLRQEEEEERLQHLRQEEEEERLHRLKQEEEERQHQLLIEKKIEEFEAGCITKFEEYKSLAELLSNRLLDLEKEVTFCKEGIAKRKRSEMLECAPSEEQVTQQSV